MKHVDTSFNNTHPFTRFLFYILLPIGIISRVYAQPTQKVFEKKVDSLFSKWDKPDSPGATIAVLKDNKVIFKKGYGAANLEYGIMNQPNSIFDIASLSKQFTAFSIATLVQAGKLSLEDDVRKYIPQLHDFFTTITIKHL